MSHTHPLLHIQSLFFFLEIAKVLEISWIITWKNMYQLDKNYLLNRHLGQEILKEYNDKHNKG